MLVATQRYLDVVYEAKLTMNPTQLSEVASGTILDLHESNISVHQENPDDLLIEETRIVSIRTLSYSALEAVVEVRYEYRDFTRNPETGERYYGRSARWQWRVERFTMPNEHGAWKVSDVEFIDWSG
jgi:hypothetical protein